MKHDVAASAERLPAPLNTIERIESSRARCCHTSCIAVCMTSVTCDSLVGIVHGHNSYRAVSGYEDFRGLETGHVAPRFVSDLVNA